jgi:hypothetical protein
MDNNHNAKCIQRRIKKQIENNDSYRFFNLLTSPELLERVESLLPEHRERLFPPTETLSMFLTQVLNTDSSCQKVVNDSAIKRSQDGFELCSTSTGGYSRARQRLPKEMVSNLTRYTGRLIDEQIPDAWRWQGRPVRLIDGTTITMPDTVQNQNAFPQQGSQKPGLGFPICRIVCISCLSSGAILNASMGRFNGKGASEHNLLRDIIDTFDEGDVVLGDAFYGSFYLLAELLDRKVDAVFEQMGPRKRVTDFRKGKKLGSKDHLIEINKPPKAPDWMSQQNFEKLPDTITLRELKIGGKTLITTLVSAKETSKAALKLLYKKRWNIELDFRAIKTTMGMETFSCKTPEMNEKEMWVYLLAYNLIRLLIAQAALLSDLLPRQISFKHALQLWLGWLSYANHTTKMDVEHLFFLIAQRQVGNRPGRIEPRAVKRRPKPFPLLMQPRGIARNNVLKNGHPKKLK